MADLRKRFGSLVAAHRKRLGMTQTQLAEATDLSPTMIVRIEGGSSGARFPNIEKIVQALNVDPAELFVVGSSGRQRMRPAMSDLHALIAGLSDGDLRWAQELLTVAFKKRD